MSSSQQLLLGEGAGGGAGAAVYIEDVFSTWLYTGTGAAQTIVNGIDLSTKGGLVWIKNRTAYSHALFDTTRGVENLIKSNATEAQSNLSGSLTSFTTSGFSVGSAGIVNDGSGSYPNNVSWTFREQPKFFDVVTYSGSSSSQTISHNLGSAPGCIMIKKLDSNTFDAGWAVYHRSLSNPNNNYLVLNTTAATADYGAPYISSVSSTTFTVAGGAGSISIAGSTYIAYIFAHDAGGFGAAGTDNVISCGKFEAGSNNPSGSATVTLGYEPQWILTKNATGTSTTAWQIYDNMRGVTALSPPSYPTSNALNPNTTGAEGSTGQYSFNATGFVNTGGYNNGDQIIYIAIRRGPMKVPTVGTSVFAPIARTGNATATNVPTGFTTDLVIDANRTRSSFTGTFFFDRLRGSTRKLSSNTTAEERAEQGMTLDTNNGINVIGTDSVWNNSGISYIYWNFQRAPSFFDEVCGNAASFTFSASHNLTVVPEMIITKDRDGASNWAVYHSALGVTKYLYLNSTNAVANASPNWSATSTTFSDISIAAGPTDAMVAYLFATCAGVSKVGSYTGTGALLTVNCGFTSGARFVLIKRTDSTGDWWTYDSARGITSSNDPYLFLNSTAAEVTNTNYVDTDTTGFKVTAAAPAGLNASGGTYIFLAIA